MIGCERCDLFFAPKKKPLTSASPTPKRELPKKEKARPFMLFDLETIPCPQFPELVDVRPLEPGEKEKLSPPLAHQIACAGYALLDEYRVRSWNALVGSERSLIEVLAKVLRDEDPVLVSFNGRKFDLPVFAARALRHGIALPWYFQPRPKRFGHGDDARYRFKHERHLDLMDFLADYGASRFASLGLWSRLIGLPGKGVTDDGEEPVTGADVARLVSEGEIELVRSYNVSDLARTGFLLLRVQLVRGVLGEVPYRNAVRAMLRSCEEQGGMAGVLAMWADQKRLLLEEEGSPHAMDGNGFEQEGSSDVDAGDP